MTFWRIACVLAVLAVLAVFFCHAMQGPYSVVHGPVTALQSVRVAAGVRTAIVQAASSVLLGLFCSVLLTRTSLVTVVDGFRESTLSAESFAILRC
jgi:hypothetical protein